VTDIVYSYIVMSDTVTFLGTAGARFVVTTQTLASGGMWLNLGGTEILVDPGPGCIVQSTNKKLKADRLSAIIGEMKPRAAILSHFGMTMWRAKPWEVAAHLSERTGVRVVAARDGMTFDLARLEETV
jgi:hypothetical protein